jgi:biotin synthase-like enzyme
MTTVHTVPASSVSRTSRQTDCPSRWSVPAVEALLALPFADLLYRPCAMVRLSAGRKQMDEPVQALCFLAGADSVFYGDKLLTTANPQAQRDRALFERLGLCVREGTPR